MRFFTFTLFLLFPFALHVPISAQSVVKSTVNKKAIQYYQKAQKSFANADWDTFFEYGYKAIETDSDFVEAHFLLGQAYSVQRQRTKALEHYQKIIQIHPDFDARIYRYMANDLMSIGYPQEALHAYEQFYLRMPDFPDPVLKQRHQLCRWRADQMKDSLRIELHNMGQNINSEYDEYLPAIPADESEIIFTVKRPRDEHTAVANAKEEEDFYISRKTDGIWQLRQPLGAPINTHYDEGAQCISPDGKYLIFTACHRQDGMGSCDLYWSKRIGDKWSKPRNFGAPVNTKYWESQPTFGADGKTILFASNRPGGHGKEDIWQTTMLEEGEFTEPVNLGQVINTDDDDFAPFLHPDGKTLYFASGGHRGMGGQDIFYSTLSPEGEWRQPVNMGYPINTIANEFNLIVNAAGEKAFFSSNKKGGFGGLDLYWFELPLSLRPEPVSYAKGIIYDHVEHTPLQATFEVIDLQTGQTVVKTTSDPVTGAFLVCIPTHKMYAFNVSKENYLFYSEHFDITPQYTELKPLTQDIALKRIELGQGVVLKNIFFDTDQATLKPESFAELQKLADLLNRNKNITIEIGGHTDNAGGREHNVILSENRAKAVGEYLKKQGVATERMRCRGYGYSKPIASNETEEGRALNRRTEFSIIGF
jgi:outer membrane protein OmpA-like peptidoglycan-associated protein